MAPTSLLGSLATLLFGVLSLVKPDATAKVTSLEPVEAAGRSEITAVFGGVFTTLGLLGLAGRKRPATLVWAGVVVARLASFRDREAISPGPVVGLLLEVGLLALFLAPEGDDEAVEVETSEVETPEIELGD